MSGNNKGEPIPPRIEDLNDLYLFAMVVEHGSFTAAGRAAGMTTSRVSRRIAGLEERLGVRLLHRTTRRLALTPIGERYYEHCRAMVAEADAAAEAIEQIRSSPRGRLRITCPVTLGQTAIGPIVAAFMQRYPEVQVSVSATDRLVDLIDDGFDVAVRYRALPLRDSSLVARTLGESHNLLVASPALLDRHGRPAHPADLATLPSLAKTGQPDAWRLHGPDGSTQTIAHRPALDSDDWLVLREAARAGIGVVAMPDEVCGADVAAGTLEVVLPEWGLPGASMHIVYASRRGVVPAVRAFIDFAAERLAVLCTERTGDDPAAR